MKTFADLTNDEISGILSDAIDSGDWHSPSVSKLEIIEQGKTIVYGKFKSSLHNTYRDEERGFEICYDSVRVWSTAMEVNGRGELVEMRRYKPIHNIVRIAGVLTNLKPIN